MAHRASWHRPCDSFLFSFQHSLSVKQSEKRRLESVLRREEKDLAAAESELKLAQQAFDQFLQDKDRKAIEAQKRHGANKCLLFLLSSPFAFPLREMNPLNLSSFPSSCFRKSPSQGETLPHIPLFPEGKYY